MSDFLTHLVSRSVDRSPRVQPRLASRFEAMATTLRLNPETLNPETLDPEGTELMVRETETIFSDGKSPVPTPLPQPKPQESSQLDKRVQQGTIAARSHAASMIPAQSAENSAIENRTIERGASEHRLPEAENLIPPSIVSPQPSRPFSSLTNPILRPPVQPLTRSIAPIEQVPSRENAALTERREEFPQTLQPDEPPIASPRIRIQPQITPRIEPSLLEFPAVATPPPPPTIHVTIGRIEVRAQTAAAPAKSKPRSPAPALTLERYLSQRSGGQT